MTLAPEMRRSSEVIQELTKRGICVSLGKGKGTQGLGGLRQLLPWGCGISNSVSVQLDGVGFSLAWPVWR